MSAAKKYPKQIYPSSSPSPASIPDAQERTRANKAEAEALREKLRSKIIDNPKTARKAALLLQLWIEGKGPKPRKK